MERYRNTQIILLPDKLSDYIKENKFMKLGFAGGAREVGGSCICIRIQDRGILFDSGIRQSGNKDPLPNFRLIQEMGGIDAIIISHAHMDHIGSLPLISRAYPNAQIYMTPMTMELSRVLLQDSLKIMWFISALAWL